MKGNQFLKIIKAMFFSQKGGKFFLRNYRHVNEFIFTKIQILFHSDGKGIITIYYSHFHT